MFMNFVFQKNFIMIFCLIFTLVFTSCKGIEKHQKLSQDEWESLFTEASLNNVEVLIKFDEASNETVKILINKPSILVKSTYYSEEYSYLILLEDTGFNIYEGSEDNSEAWSLSQKDVYKSLTWTDVIMQHTLISGYADKYSDTVFDEKENRYDFTDYKKRNVSVYIENSLLSSINIRGNSTDAETNSYIDISFVNYGNTDFEVPILEKNENTVDG